MIRALFLALTLPFVLHATPAIHRGINLGSALEAQVEGQRGPLLQSDYFSVIHNAGLDTVRVPINWVAHAGQAPDYVIDPRFFERIDWVISNARANSEIVILDYQPDPDLMKEPDRYSGRFLAIWKQIAERYRNEPDSVFFELLNEPRDAMLSDKWNALIPRVLAVIRPTNPTRTLVVGPDRFNRFDHLPALQLPESDRHLLVTFHYYFPMEFTHQGADWIKPLNPKWLGTKWGTAAQEAVIVRDFGVASGWAKAHHRPLFLGEFGTFSPGDMNSRVRWTKCCARTAENLGIGWAYWEFRAGYWQVGTGFGIYDPATKQFIKPLLNALVPPAN